MKGHEVNELFPLGKLNKTQKFANLRPMLSPVLFTFALQQLVNEIVVLLKSKEYVLAGS